MIFDLISSHNPNTPMVVRAKPLSYGLLTHFLRTSYGLFITALYQSEEHNKQQPTEHSKYQPFRAPAATNQKSISSYQPKEHSKRQPSRAYAATNQKSISSYQPFNKSFTRKFKWPLHCPIVQYLKVNYSTTLIEQSNYQPIEQSSYQPSPPVCAQV